MEERGQSSMTSPTGVTTAHDRDRQKLHELGYAQELARKMGGFAAIERELESV